MSDRFTLRLEPSVLLAQSESDRFLVAIEDVCARLASGDALSLTRFLSAPHKTSERVYHSARDDWKFAAYDDVVLQKTQRPAPAVKVGWLCHLVDADDLISLESAYGEMPFEEREDYLAHFIPRLSPIVMGATDVQSATGRVVRVYPILLPFTSKWVKRQLDERQLALPQELVQQGVDCAAALGCQTVSLGQYTSIATLNGMRVTPRGMGVTTGNSYAIALAIQALELALRETEHSAADSVLVVVGAAGNIGRTLAEMLAPHYRRTLLIGSDKPGALRRLQEFARQLPRTSAASDLGAICEGNVVAAALNAVNAPLSTEHFKRGAIVCDLSVPACLSPGMPKSRPDLLLIKGGIVSLPFGEDLEIVGFPLPAGQTFGCMAEGMLLGLEGIRDQSFTGSLSAERVGRIAEMAALHGFKLADHKRACVLGSDRKEATYAVAR